MLQLTLLAVAAALVGVDAQFIDLTNSSTPLSCLAESTGVHVPGTVPCNPYEPLQQHLAFASPTGMTVSWSTHAQLDTPQVWYGECPTALTNVATGNSSTYPTSRVWDNHVKLTGLKPNTQYWYRTSYQFSVLFIPILFRFSPLSFAETVLGVHTDPPTPSPLLVKWVTKAPSQWRSSSILD